MFEWSDVALRLGAATVVGAAIGLDRDLRGKPTGVRTMSIVALGSALIVLTSQYPAHAEDQAAASRVMQGIITGIGFLGAGVIIRDSGSGRVHGLTTAAAIWLTACIGAACGAAAWQLVFIASLLVAIVLGGGRILEEIVERHVPHRPSGQDDGPTKAGGL